MWLVALLAFALGCSEVAQRGPKGDEGDRGPRGEQGKTGERGPQGLRGQLGQARVVQEHVDVPMVGYAAAVATCGEGETLVAGGCEWGKDGNDMHPIATRPAADDDGDAVGWSCTGVALLATSIDAFALCADGAP